MVKENKTVTIIPKGVSMVERFLLGRALGLYIEIFPRGGGGKFGVRTKEGGGGGGGEAYMR